MIERLEAGVAKAEAETGQLRKEIALAAKEALGQVAGQVEGSRRRAEGTWLYMEGINII